MSSEDPSPSNEKILIFQETLNDIIDMMDEMVDKEIPEANEAFREFQNLFRESMQYKKLIKGMVEIIKEEGIFQENPFIYQSDLYQTYQNLCEHKVKIYTLKHDFEKKGYLVHIFEVKKLDHSKKYNLKISFPEQYFLED